MTEDISMSGLSGKAAGNRKTASVECSRCFAGMPIITVGLGLEC